MKLRDRIRDPGLEHLQAGTVSRSLMEEERAVVAEDRQADGVLRRDRHQRPDLPDLRAEVIQRRLWPGTLVIVRLKSRVAYIERAAKLWITGGMWRVISISVLEPVACVPAFRDSASSIWRS